MWTSGGAILRDLSRAQGAGARGLHAELRALRPRDRPPPPPRWLSEEMEEYMRGLAPAGAACEGGPDLRHIQQMLDMVRKLNITEKEVVNDVPFINKLDSYAIERSRSINLCKAELAGSVGTAPAVALGLPARTSSAAAPALAPRAVQGLSEPNKHKKRRRNIALESILEALENNYRNDANNCTSEQSTLLKLEGLTEYPENLNKSTDHKHVKDVHSYDTPDTHDKVHHWMNRIGSPTRTNSRSKQVLREAMRLDPSSMFKKKVKVEVAKSSTKLNCEAALRNERSPGNGSASYVPSAEASLCYQRYLENNKRIQDRRKEASQLAALITEALEQAAQAEATELAALEEDLDRAALAAATERLALEQASERGALEEAPDRTTLEEAPELAALVQAPERAALEQAPERAALEQTPERAALEEAPERAALEEALEQATLAEASERAALQAASERTACVESGVSRAVLAAPAGARLVAPRVCLPQAPCVVCARLTRRPAPPQGSPTVL